MANHKDALKRIKQNEKRRVQNRHYRSRMRNQIKNVHSAIEGGDHAAALTALKEATGVIHRNASKGIIHRNQAARRISRLNRAVKALATS